MDVIQISATFRGIPADKLDEFKGHIADAIEIARGEETTLGYDWYFGDDESTVYIREVYADSDAVLSHLAAVGAQLGAMLGMGATLEVEVFGNPSPALLEAGAAFNPTVHPHYAGK